MLKTPFLLLVLLVCITTSMYAQESKTETLPDGGTKTTTITKEGTLNGSTKTEEVTRNADGTMREYKISISYKDFVSSVTDSIFGKYGKIKRVTVVEKINPKDTSYREEANFNEDGVMLESQKREYNPINGNVMIRWYRQGKGNSFDRRDKDHDPGPLPAREEPSAPMAPIELKGKLHLNKDWLNNSSHFTGGIDYSFLRIGSGKDGTTIPLGGALNLNYFFTKDIAVGANFSYHSKKEKDIKLTEMFLMGSFSYIFLHMPANKQRDFQLFARAMAGMIKEREKITFGSGIIANEKGFAMAFGLGLAYPFGNNLYFTFFPEYLRVKFSEKDSGSGGFRTNLGARITF